MWYDRDSEVFVFFMMASTTKVQKFCEMIGNSSVLLNNLNDVMQQPWFHQRLKPMTDWSVFQIFIFTWKIFLLYGEFENLSNMSWVPVLSKSLLFPNINQFFDEI